LLLLLFATLLTGANLWSGPAWAEMPSDRALLAVNRGPVAAVVDGHRLDLGRGQRVYVRESDTVAVPERANAQLTFHGGAVVLLCGGTTLAVGDIATAGARASGSLLLTNGLLLAETHPESRAFTPLRLSVRADATTVHNNDGARFAVSTGG